MTIDLHRAAVLVKTYVVPGLFKQRCGKVHVGLLKKTAHSNRSGQKAAQLMQIRWIPRKRNGPEWTRRRAGLLSHSLQFSRLDNSWRRTIPLSKGVAPLLFGAFESAPDQISQAGHAEPAIKVLDVIVDGVNGQSHTCGDLASADARHQFSINFTQSRRKGLDGTGSPRRDASRLAHVPGELSQCITVHGGKCLSGPQRVKSDEAPFSTTAGEYPNRVDNDVWHQ